MDHSKPHPQSGERHTTPSPTPRPRSISEVQLGPCDRGGAPPSRFARSPPFHRSISLPLPVFVGNSPISEIPSFFPFPRLQRRSRTDTLFPPERIVAHTTRRKSLGLRRIDAITGNAPCGSPC